MEWLGIVLAISQAIGAIGTNAQQLKTLFSSDCKPEFSVYKFVGDKDTAVGKQRVIIEQRGDTTTVILMEKR